MINRFFARASGARFLSKWSLTFTTRYWGNDSGCVKCLHKPFKNDHHHFRNSLLNVLVHIPVFDFENMSKMSMLGTFSIMPGTLKLKYIPVISATFCVRDRCLNPPLISIFRHSRHALYSKLATHLFFCLANLHNWPIFYRSGTKSPKIIGNFLSVSRTDKFKKLSVRPNICRSRTDGPTVFIFSVF